MAQTDDIRTLILSALAEACHCSVSELDENSSIIELGVDSLSLTNIAAQLEAQYGLELTEEALLRLLESQRVGDLIGLAETLLAQEPLTCAQSAQ